MSAAFVFVPGEAYLRWPCKSRTNCSFWDESWLELRFPFPPTGTTMTYTPELVHELNTLIRFDLDSGQQGIKVHKSADENVKTAARRLHAKGLITQADGGYLTRLGREAAEHAQAMLGILTAGVAAAVTSPSQPET
jgi:uncharacterized protein (TIGR02647 family)